MTQRELAIALDMSPGAVTNWIKGDNKPAQATLESIVVVLGVTMERFYGRIPKARRAA